MRKLEDILSEDTNQFGPGTDLTVSLLAVLMVMTLITASLYRQEIEKRERLQQEIAAHQGGNFRLASDFFSAADFKKYPVIELESPQSAHATVRRIVTEYEWIGGDYPWIFVIGHSSRLDDRDAHDRSLRARRDRNWNHAGRRATVIAGLLLQHLDDAQAEKVVVVTTGELDLKDPKHPTSQENAWVEVVFGKEWKRPSRNRK